MSTINSVNSPLSGTTGTGNFVGSNSPSLTSPALDTPTSLTLTNATGLVPATGLTSVTGTGAAVLATSPTITTPVLVGVTSGSAAASGDVAQIVSSTVNPSPGVSMTSNTSANITSISLPAGDWDIMAQIALLPAGTTVIQGFATSISLTSATLGSNYNINESLEELTGMSIAGAPVCASISEACANISTTTTYYLVANIGFTVSTLTAGGKIIARRRR